MNPLRRFAPSLLTLLLLGIGAVPAAAVDYTITGTLTQDPTDPFPLGINGTSFEVEGSAGGGAISSSTTSTQSEATYNISGMQFSLGNDPPASCTGTPILTLLDRVSGSDRVSMDDCEVVLFGFPASLDGSLTIPGGNMATSAPADISSTSATGSFRLRVSFPDGTVTFNFDVNNGSLSANGAEPPSVSIMPSSVSLAADFGSTTPEEQEVSFSASQAVSYSISTSGGSWLDVTPTAGNTSSTITISADPTGLTPGTYNGSVMLSYGSQAADSIPVEFEITGSLPTLSLNPSSLTFNYEQGDPDPAAQELDVTSSAPLSVDNVTVSTTSGGSWLSANPTSGATPLEVSVSVDPSGLSPGTYNGTVTVASDDASNSPRVASVTLNVTSASTISLDPSSLTFNFQLGDAAPPAQDLDVSATNGPISFTAARSTMSGGNWLSVTPSGGDTPETLSVSVNPSGLSAGNYSGTVTVSSASANNSPQAISVTLNVSAAPVLNVNPTQLTFNHEIGGPPPNARTVNVTGSQPLSYTVAASGGDWLSVSSMGGDTPGSFDVMADVSGLTPGTYNGTVSVASAGAGNSPRVIPVTLNVTPAPLTVSHSQLTFNHQVGTAPPASRMIQVSSAVPTNFSVSVSGGPWLSASPDDGTTPETVTVSVNPSALAPGNYFGSVTISPQPAGPSPRIVNISLTVIGPPLSASPTQLTFSAQSGGSVPAPRDVMLSAPAATDFTAEVTLGAAFLSVSPEAGTTPGSVSVAVDPDGLEPGTYNGTVTFTPDGGSPVSTTVLLTVSTNPSLTAAPESLSFTYYVNGEAPDIETVSLSATEVMSFAVAASGGDWLGVSPGDGMTPADLTVAIDPMGLEPGAYLGEISIAAAAAGNSPVVIPVMLNVILAPVFSSDSLLNAASFQLGESPATGGLATVFGFFPGAAEGGALEIPLPAELHRVAIRMRPLAAALPEAGPKGEDAYTPAPLLFVSGTQINFQTPWEIPPGPAEMIVTADGVDSEPVEVLLTEVNPGIFTFDYGPGRAVAFLPEGVVAQPEGSIPGVVCRPIRVGEVLVVLATGLGPLTGPPLASGDDSLDEGGVYIRRDTVFPARVLIGGQEAEVLFAGASPQFVGVNQVNVTVPEGVEPGAEVTLVLEVNGLQSRTDVTIAVDPAQ